MCVIHTHTHIHIYLKRDREAEAWLWGECLRGDSLSEQHPQDMWDIESKRVNDRYRENIDIRRKDLSFSGHYKWNPHLMALQKIYLFFNKFWRGGEELLGLFLKKNLYWLPLYGHITLYGCPTLYGLHGESIRAKHPECLESKSKSKI